MNTYQLDTAVTLTVQFTNDAEQPADPTDVFLYVQAPNSPEQTFQFSLGQITRTGTGAYEVVVNLNASGPWVYKWQGTGNVEVTTPDTVMLVASSALLGG